MRAEADKREKAHNERLFAHGPNDNLAEAEAAHREILDALEAYAEGEIDAAHRNARMKEAADRVRHLGFRFETREDATKVAMIWEPGNHLEKRKEECA